MTYFRIAMCIAMFAVSGCYQILGFSEFEFEPNDTATSTFGSETEIATENDMNSDTVASNKPPTIETESSSDTQQESAAGTIADSDTVNNTDTPTVSPQTTDSRSHNNSDVFYETEVDSDTELNSDTRFDTDTSSEMITGNSSDLVTDMESDGEVSETDAGPSIGTDTDNNIIIDSETNPEAQCLGKENFTRCDIVTEPDRSYDICVDETCVSPGCGDASCNVPGPHFPLADTNQRFCYDTSDEIDCPMSGDAFFGQDAQYGWDGSNSANQRFSTDVSESGYPVVIDNITGLNNPIGKPPALPGGLLEV